MQSEKSKKRIEQRNSPATQEFKLKIIELLNSTKDKDDEVVYSIIKDLSVMTNMPFYKERPKKIKITKSPREMIKAYVKLLCDHDDKEFAIKVLKNLNKNQAQTLRKAAPRIGSKKEIWEHAIPAKIIVDELIVMIKSKDMSMIDTLLDVYYRAGQRALTKDEDQLLSKYRCSMPEGWNWKDPNVNPLARYSAVGIEL